MRPLKANTATENPITMSTSTILKSRNQTQILRLSKIVIISKNPTKVNLLATPKRKKLTKLILLDQGTKASKAISKNKVTKNKVTKNKEQSYKEQSYKVTKLQVTKLQVTKLQVTKLQVTKLQVTKIKATKLQATRLKV